MLDRLNSPYFAALFLIAFIWLSYMAMHREMGYSHSVFEVLPSTLKQRQAATLRDIYGITGNEVASAIWGN